jgi:hypothetical protein
MNEHVVTAVPRMKLSSSTPLGYLFQCSCGREGRGVHRTAEKAIERGHDHIMVEQTTETTPVDLPGLDDE